MYTQYISLEYFGEREMRKAFGYANGYPYADPETIKYTTVSRSISAQDFKDVSADTPVLYSVWDLYAAIGYDHKNHRYLTDNTLAEKLGLTNNHLPRECTSALRAGQKNKLKP